MIKKLLGFKQSFIVLGAMLLSIAITAQNIDAAVYIKNSGNNQYLSLNKYGYLEFSNTAFVWGKDASGYYCKVILQTKSSAESTTISTNDQKQCYLFGEDTNKKTSIASTDTLYISNNQTYRTGIAPTGGNWQISNAPSGTSANTITTYNNVIYYGYGDIKTHFYFNNMDINDISKLPVGSQFIIQASMGFSTYVYTSSSGDTQQKTWYGRFQLQPNNDIAIGSYQGTQTDFGTKRYYYDNGTTYETFSIDPTYIFTVVSQTPFILKSFKNGKTVTAGDNGTIYAVSTNTARWEQWTPSLHTTTISYPIVGFLQSKTYSPGTNTSIGYVGVSVLDRSFSNVVKLDFNTSKEYAPTGFYGTSRSLQIFSIQVVDTDWYNKK